MDLNTPPPPSYESATGAPGVHNQINPFLNAPPPSAPPLQQQNHEIIYETVTTPILSQPYDPNQNTCQLTMPTPQTNKKSSTSSKVFSCCLALTYVIICVTVIMVVLSKAKPKPKSDLIPSISVTERNKYNEWQEKWRKDQVYIDRLRKRSETWQNHNWNSYKND